MNAVEFSLSKFENPIYSNRFRKYFKKNIFLDTYAFCLVVLGKFDETYDYDTLGGESEDFMNIDNYLKLWRLVNRYNKGRLIITPAVVVESLRHMFDAIKNKYGSSDNRKDIENEFACFLQNEIKMFKEKYPSSSDMLNHNWTQVVMHHKLSDRFEAGDLSIFVELDKCKYATVIAKDGYKINKGGESFTPQNAIIVQLNYLDAQ